MNVLRSALRLSAYVALSAALSACALAQSATDLVALKGLAPVTVLNNTTAGKAALAANYVMTGGIQTGAVRQSTLLTFAAQQQQSLQDAYITYGNFAQLADGLGTTLGGAYIARAHYTDRDHYTSISQRVADLIAYANHTSAANSNSGKFFFANSTTNGKTPVSAEAAAILTANKGHADPFGIAYHLTGGSPNADAYGDSRPFQTEREVLPFVGNDYFNTPASNDVYNRGPVMDLINSPSYPSGHTTYGYTGSMLLALLVPERYPQMVARGAEYGNDRIIMGAHYTMDVLGGRTLALYDLAHLLANDPAYVGQHYKKTPT
ncbi:MAG: phosphatase PAP2 family protein, partial [Bryocella sp.]